MRRRGILDRLEALERRIKAVLPFWSNDDDGFLAALGVDPHKYERRNHDGSVGYDMLAAIRATAADDWADGDDSKTF